MTVYTHEFLMYIEIREETDIKSWVYNMPPQDEKDGHEVLGTKPVWQLVRRTDHFICQTGATTVF